MDVKRTLFWLFIFLSFSSHADVSKDGIYQDFRHYTDNVAHYDLRTISKAPSTLWQPLETRTPNYSFSTATHWIRIDFHNPTQTIFQGYLAVKTPHQDYISSLLLYDDGQQQEFYTGDRMPHNTRPMKHRHFHFPVNLKPMQSATLYLQIQSHDGFIEPLPLELLHLEEWHESTLSESILFGLYYGAAIILILYNLALYLSTKDNRFAAYTVYLFSFSSWNLTFTGYSFQYLWPDSPNWNNQFLAISVILSFWSFSYLGCLFLELKKQAPSLYKALMWANSVLLIPLYLALRDDYAHAFSVMIPLVSLLSIALMSTAAWLALKGQGTAQIFFSAWLILITSLVVYLTQLADILPASTLMAQAINVGSLMEFFILAIALALHFNQKQQDSIIYQTELAERRTLRNQQLQHMVEERTVELDQAKNKLADIAMTDQLTGLFNRRRFSMQLEQLLKHPFTEQQCLYLILVDLDDFKTFNDRFGHTAGDLALTQFARLLLHAFSGLASQVFRVGGEEFSILLKANSSARIQSSLTLLSSLAEQKEVEVPGLQCDKLKFSVGVAVVQAKGEKPSSSDVFRLADEALYSAKASYRSTPVFRTWQADRQDQSA